LKQTTEYTLLRRTAGIIKGKTRTETVLAIEVNDSYSICKKHGSHDLMIYFRETFNRDYCLPALHWLCPYNKYN